MYAKWLLAAALGALLSVVANAAPRPVVHRSMVVVLDPGHGGSNDGCASPDGTVLEKQVTLALAKRLQRRLRETLPHADVVLTRGHDETLTLAQRVAAANTRGADLFLSLHANASPSRDQHGFESYVLDIAASGKEAARTAMRENDSGFATPRRDSEVVTMLRELSLVSNRTDAAFLAKIIQHEQAQRFPERRNRGVKQAPFDVLMGTRMPAVLFEAGFLDHADEGGELLDAEFQSQVVDGLSAAVVRYYRDVYSRR